MLRFSCPACRTVLQVEPRLAGAAVACSRCRQTLRVPAAAPLAIPVPVPMPRSAPKPVRKARRPAWFWVVMALLSMAGGVGGSYLLFHALLKDSQETRPVPVASRPQATKAKEEPAPAPLDMAPPIPEPRQAPAKPAGPDTKKEAPVRADQREPVNPPAGSNPRPDPVRQVGKIHSGSPITRDANWYVCFPAPDQQEVPWIFPGNEAPDPIPESPDKLAGYPVTLTFAPLQKVRQVQAELKDEEGKAVLAWFSTPEKPANPRFAREQSNTVCLIPQKPLRPGCTYTVAVRAQVDGREWTDTWHFTTRGEEEDRRQNEQEALDRINHYRKLASLEPVTLNPARSAACRAHARYLAVNLPAHPELEWNDEDPTRPGATTEGRSIARGSAIFLGGGARGLIDWMLSSFINRHVLLEPNLRSIGLGFALFPGRGRAWVLNAHSDQPVGAVKEGLVYPVDGQKDVPLAYHMGSRPLPYPSSHHGKEVGFALTARLPGGEIPANVTARLTDSRGAEVPLWLSTGNQPAVAGTHQTWIGLVPQTPLQEGTTYTATVTGQRGGQPWQKHWSFTTTRLDEKARAQLAGHLLERLNRQRRLAGLEPVELDAELSHGCDLHCRYIVRHFTHPSVQGLGQHEEDPKLEGYTPEGRKAGKASVIANDPHPQDAVDSWLATLYHRIPLLHPSLKRIGFGIIRLPDQNFMTMIDSGSDVRGR